MNLNTYIDHTLLKPTATPDDIIKLCSEAREYQFYGVCVNSCYAKLATKELLHSGVKVISTIGFPLGASSKSAKLAEAKKCIEDGADEVDMVMNIGSLKYKLYQSIQEEISAIKNIIGDKILKVIIETCYLTDDEKRIACLLVAKSGADFVKTSTGFGTGGASELDVKLMVNEVGNEIKIKASGGIKDLATARKYINLGVSRIGTSSGIAIVTSTE